MFERFTDRGRRVLVLAQEEARLLDHNFIGTEHVLAGLIHEGEGVAAKTLGELGVALEVVRDRILGGLDKARGASTGSPSFTPGAKKALERALREALRLGHDYIGTEHLLLGILADPDDPTVTHLAKLGAEPERIRAKTLEALRANPDPTEVRGTVPDGGTADPTCPSCGALLTRSAVWSTLDLPSASQTENLRPVVIVHCRACGRAIGVVAAGG